VVNPMDDFVKVPGCAELTAVIETDRLAGCDARGLPRVWGGVHLEHSCWDSSGGHKHFDDRGLWFRGCHLAQCQLHCGRSGTARTQRY